MNDIAHAQPDDLDLPSLRAFGERLHVVDADFDPGTFFARVSEGFEALDLEGRARHAADALAEQLPASFADAVGLLIDASPLPRPLSGEGEDRRVVLPALELVARNGREHWRQGMNGLHQLTTRCSAERQLRIFVEADFPETFRVLKLWTRDLSAHVRMLVARGIRPYLPGAEPFSYFADRPDPALDLLDLLKDDPIERVRAEVAEAMNDISRENPGPTFDTLAYWKREATPERRALVQASARTLIEGGYPYADALLRP
ncbi:MAG: hypothetical protein P1V51_08110 [Deltaproteobacteria bacterium]|nr:hypothetical protein [Deltaproteobacteria bacterium]